jgi:WD40 repeat protein
MSVALLPNKVIVSGDFDGAVKMWDGEEGKLLKTMTGGSTRPVWSVVSDGKRVFSCASDGDVRVFDIESGACTEVLFRAPAAVYCLALRGNVLVAGCDDGKLRCWDVRVGSASMREFEDAKIKYHIRALEFQEGVGPARVVSADARGEVRLWDVQTGRCLSVLPAHAQTYNPGRFLAADLNRLVYSDGNDIKMLDFSP